VSLLTRLYLAFSQVSGPIWRLVLKKRLQKGKEDPARLSEKYGVAPQERPAGTVLWFHALSVGESLALLPLVDCALEDDDTTVVITTSTATSIAALEKACLPERAIHVLLPMDTAKAARRFLDHWKPRVAVFAELDFWPRLMIETHRRQIPMVLVNSRMSAESYTSRRRLRGMMRDILQLFDRLLVQDPESAVRFQELGASASRITVAGALKAAARPLQADQAKLELLQTRIGKRPVWLAAATRDIEEAAMLRAHLEITRKVPNALMIVAPRFLQSANDIESEAQNRFTYVARRSRGELPDDTTQVYIADTIGEMGLWYRIAPISFVGHSLGPEGKPLGGKNPYEAAALQSVILHGPAVSDFSETYQGLQEADASVLVHNEAELTTNVLRLFSEAQRVPILDAADSVVKARQGVVETTWDAISKAL